jgi:hypothetical protein
MDAATETMLEKKKKKFHLIKSIPHLNIEYRLEFFCDLADLVHWYILACSKILACPKTVNIF